MSIAEKISLEMLESKIEFSNLFTNAEAQENYISEFSEKYLELYYQTAVNRCLQQTAPIMTEKVYSIFIN